MKSYSIEFDNIESLELFINNNNLEDEKSVLIQIFSGVIDVSVLKNISKTIYSILPNSKIIGATTDGEIINHSVNTKSIIISFTIFKHTSVKIAHEKNICAKTSYDAGKRIACNLIESNSKAFILFVDGLHTNGEEFLNGVNKIAKDIIISGGLAGDNAKFTKTYLIYNNNVISNGVVGVSLNSDILKVQTDFSFAWTNVGKQFVVNKSDKERVYEIDNMPTYKLYEKYLGSDIAKLLPEIGIEFPLIIQNNDMPIARATLIKHDDNSLTFAGNIKEGSVVKFGVANSSVILNDARELAIKYSKINSQVLFIYSCMARRRFLGDKILCDVKSLSKISKISGFFTYGEFFTSKHKDVYLLNETMTILSLSESDKKVDKISEIKRKVKNRKSITLEALSHLINVSNDELNELNENLEIKVSEEILKNKEFEKRIFNSKKMASLGDMISNIAHQWRQPLSIITTSASGMQLHKELGILSDEMFSKYTAMIVTQGQHLSETIDIFRNYIQDNHIFTDVIVQDEIKTTLNLLKSVIKDNNIKLIDNIDYDSKLQFKLISGELSQVIINIINNAKDILIQRGIKNKKIIISLKTIKNKCIISIEDNAGGIEEHIIGKIFEPYFTTKNNKFGTGIGLYMSYDIITKHLKGDLYVKNTKIGAKFFIEVPMNIKELQL